MKQKINYNRIKKSLDMFTMSLSHIVIVGVGGSNSLVHALVRSGIGQITTIDPDVVDETNLARQGYTLNDIGDFKVDALEKSIRQIRPDIAYEGIPKKLQELTEDELDMTFRNASVILYLTDSFEASAYGNKLSLEYFLPSIWAGWYLDTRMAEVIITAPELTTACYRCIASSRYEAYEKGNIPNASSVGNTMFHSQMIDGIIGQLAMALIHYPKGNLPWFGKDDSEAKQFIGSLCSEKGYLEYNFLQFTAHPLGGNNLFKIYDKHKIPAPAFTSYWQKVGPELKSTGYEVDCPDCKGLLMKMVEDRG